MAIVLIKMFPGKADSDDKHHKVQQAAKAKKQLLTSITPLYSKASKPNGKDTSMPTNSNS